MPRDTIQKAEFIDSIQRQVADMGTVFNSRKNNLAQMFQTLVDFRDDVDTPSNYVAVLQTKIDQGKALVQTMLDSF